MRFIDQLDQAASVMDDWVGEGAEPVDTELSTRRAECCIRCPMNTRSEEWWAGLKTASAELIRLTLQLKSEMKMSTRFDAELKGCAICGCVLKLKVHVPLRHILATAPAEQLKQFQQVNCWITTERESNELR